MEKETKQITDHVIQPFIKVHLEDGIQSDCCCKMENKACN